MSKYHDLAERARLASATRRQNNAELNKLISNGLGQDTPVEGGKFAENKITQNSNIAYENNGCGDHIEERCLVNTHHRPPTPSTTPHPTPTEQTTTYQLHDLIKSPEVQKKIRAAKAHTKRMKTRGATLQMRVAVPTVSWKRASVDDKFRFAGHATEQAGGQAFTLHLSDKAQKKIRAHSDPLRAFTDTLNRELKKAGLSGVPYALALEDSTKGKLHVHGFLIPPQCSKDAIRQALRAAGGTISGKAGSRQLSIKKLSGAAGWAFYCRKDQKQTDEAMVGKARLFLNQAMTSVAREFSSAIM